MALNPFFQQGTRAEQNLVQSLINEQLKIYGVEIYYIPRDFIRTNTVIREVVQSEFTDSYPLEAYVENYEGFQGSNDLMTKFGVRVTDELNLVISKERYDSYIKPLLEGKYNNDSTKVKLFSRPKEGDLIWFPYSDTIFEIKYVEHEQPFYQLKETYVYQLRCEVFEYDNEVIDTGIVDIDDNVKDDGYILTLNLAGIGSTATAITSLVSGAVTKLTLLNGGIEYTSTPLVTITQPQSGGTQATAVAITTQLDSGTYVIDDLRLINPGAGYTVAPTVRFIDSTGTGAIATAGISTLNSIGVVTVTSNGSEYITKPTVTVSGPSTGNTSILDPVIVSDTVTQLRIINAGYGYTVAPTITISTPAGISTGNYVYNEIVTGQTSGIKARVKDWNYGTKTLKVGMLNGNFKIGERIVGSASTIENDWITANGDYVLKSTGSSASSQSIKFDTSDTYSESVQIESEAVDILDFTEKHPFGNF